MSNNSGAGLRLPPGVRPVEYDLKITPDFQTWTFKAIERVQLVVDKPTRDIVLHAVDLDIFGVSFYQDNKTITASHVSYNQETESIKFKFPVPIKKGGIELVISFRGRISDTLVGFYRSRYELPDGTEQSLATTQFEATDARRAFPCWDEPAFKAQFRLTLCIPNEYMALSNMPVQEERIVEDMREVVFFPTPRMSTYLLAYAVGNLESVEQNTKNGTRVAVFATPGKLNQCMFALGIATRALEYLEDYFGIKYPLPELKLAAIPDFAAGAMENWGLITFRELRLLFDDESSSMHTKQAIAAVVAHELVHQWFGNLVTMQWWNDLWLNESFASFMGDKVVADLFPEWNWWEEFYSSDTARAFALDALQNTHPIEVPVDDANQIGEIFDAISYSKGASILRMLEQYVGEQAFRKGLSIYLARHAYGNTVTEDLWAALAEASGKDVAAVMDSWTKQPGFPLILVADEGNGHRIGLRISQERFFAFPEEATQNNQLWQVPIEVQTAHGKPICMLMRQAEERISLPRQARRAWLRVNPGHTGFYRVHYDEHLLQALYPAIAEGDLPAIDCLGMHDDLWALVRARYIPAYVYLDALAHFAAGEEYVLWSDMGGSLASLVRLLEREPYLGELEKFARGVFMPRAGSLGWDAVPNEPDSDTLLRPVVFGLLGEWHDAAIIKEAQKRFAVLVQDPASIAPNLQAIVCAIAARTGNAATYQSLLELYRTAYSQEQKMRYIWALGSFPQAALLTKTLGMCLSGAVRMQDVTGVLASCASTNRGITWQFMKDNWAALYAMLQGDKWSVRYMVSGVVPLFLTVEELQDAESFFAEHPVPEAERALAQAFETARKNITWIAANREAVGKWLKERAKKRRLSKCALM